MKITKKHNGHIRGKFVLITLLIKRGYFKIFSVVNQRHFIPHTMSYALINVMPERGGPRDRVGTLIRNKNLESNLLTLGIRFQIKVPHLGEGFEFNNSHETENFKPSDHEVKNSCVHLTRLSMIVLLQ